MGVTREEVWMSKTFKGRKQKKICFRPASELVRVKHPHSKRFILGSNEQLVNWDQIECLDFVSFR